MFSRCIEEPTGFRVKAAGASDGVHRGSKIVNDVVGLLFTSLCIIPIEESGLERYLI